jgi:predicted MFS family arabinose efflux permease
MPLRLFASAPRAAAYAARMLFLGAMIGFFFFTTQYLQAVAGYPPSMTGLAFLPMTLVNFAVALQVPRLTRRLGNARLLAIGLAVCMVGMVWLSRVVPGSAYLTAIALPMVLIGAGQGMVLSPLTAAGIAGVAAADAGAASGVVNVAHQLGNALGLAVLVALAGASGLAQRVTTALSASSVFLLLALLLMVWPVGRRVRLFG